MIVITCLICRQKKLRALFLNQWYLCRQNCALRIGGFFCICGITMGKGEGERKGEWEVGLHLQTAYKDILQS